MRWPKVPTLQANIAISCVFSRCSVGGTGDVDHVYDELYDATWDSPGSSRSQNLRDCKVVKVELCKIADAPGVGAEGQGQGQQLEFVLATVHHPANANCPRVLRFERCSERTNPNQYDSDRDVDIIRDKVGHYGTERDALKARYRFPPQVKQAYSCWTLTFKEDQNPNALDLFSAATVLHRVGQNDTSIVPMNYWYAHNLFRLLAYGREHIVNTTHSIWAPTPGFFFGLPIIDSLGKIKDRPQDISLEELAAREAEKRPLFQTLISSFTPNEDTTTAEFSISPMPQGSFIPSDDVVEYHKGLLGAVAKVEKQISQQIETREWIASSRMDSIVGTKITVARLKRSPADMSEIIAQLEQNVRRMESRLLDLYAQPQV